MIGALKRAYEGFRGFGDYAFSIPPLDGAFLPNSALDGAPVLVPATSADNLCTCGETVLFSDGPCVVTLGGDTHMTFDKDITALAGDAKGRLAVALGDTITLIAANGTRSTIAPPRPGCDVTAMCFLGDGALAVAIGSEKYRRADWQNDHMIRGRSGSVWIVAANGAATRLAQGLAYPLGLAETPDGGIAVAVAWDHAVMRITRSGQISALLENLPGYPNRIIAADGGYWLSFLAIRNQLVEFALREKVFVRRMMAEVQREFWVCPQLQPPQSPMSVMQAGAERHHGEMKPWAPSLSYGMVARLDAAFRPQFTLHSRANGDRHGLTSMTTLNGRLLASSYAARGIVELPTTGASA